VLQITTGKVFTRPSARENLLRGVLYTNLRLEFMNDAALAAPSFGRVVQTSELSSFPHMVVYEFTERIEADQSGRNIRVSHGADPYVQDMGMVMSFFFNCTCSPDIDLVRRLLGGRPGTSTGKSPASVIRRIFDKDIFLKTGESAEFVKFANHLLGLKRKTYLGVMDAIRTFVTGIHRVADDFELAYTLLVAAIESLAQNFDDFTPDWESVADDKRNPIDQALEGSSKQVAQRVRTAMLGFEHIALGRRFQEFVVANVSSEYFSGPFEKDSFPPGRSDLPELLSAAYKARSQYVHQLKELPDALTLGNSQVESVTLIDGRQRMLTLQGIVRLFRNVIMTFIYAQPVVDKEVYDYRHELAGVTWVRFGPRANLADVDAELPKVGRNMLEEFLEHVGNVFMDVPGAIVPDVTPLLTKFLSLAHGMKRDERRPYFLMLVVFNSVAGPKSLSLARPLEKLLEADFKDACPESLLAHAFFQQAPTFSLDAHQAAMRAYMRKRGRPSGLRFPRVFEAAVALELAERYRIAGMFDRCRETAVHAADDFPEHAELRAAVAHINDTVPLNWSNLLLPTRASPDDSTNGSVSSTLAATPGKIIHRRVKRSVRALRKRSILRD
jgi:hypothetical protein